MKFIASSGTLLKQLQAIQGALTTSTTLPILECFLFDIQDGTLTITATDLQTSMTCRMQVECKENGKIAIPSRMLLDTLKTFNEQPVVFTIDNDSKAVELSAGDGTYKLVGENGDDFPKIAQAEGANNITMSASVLSESVNKTIFAVSNDELRPAMTGVYVNITTDSVTFVATDAHKLVRCRRFDTKGDKDYSLILPKKALTLLKNALPPEDVQVSLDFNASHAFFKFGTIQLVCRLIDEKYPDYEAVIPLNNPNKMIIERNTLLTSIRRVGLYASKATNQIRLKISGSELNITAEDIDFSNEAKEKLTCQYEGEDIEIGFNAKFLMDMLSNLDSDEVSLEMSTPNRAGILLPGNAAEDKSQQLLMLVMPVMINN